MTPTLTLLRTDRFLAVNTLTGGTIWAGEAGLADPIPVRGMLSVGYRGGILVGTTPATAYRFDPATGDVSWEATTPDPGRIYSLAHAGVSPDVVYLPTLDARAFSTRGIEARSVVHGSRLWVWERSDTAGPHDLIAALEAFGEGLAVVPFWDGTVTVIGHTGASLGAPSLRGEEYPAVGERVRVDLSNARPGAFGAATRWRADWGDGTVTDWQDSPHFEHISHAHAPTTARFTVGNDANQTPSTTLLYRVGEAEPNWISVAFSPERQEATFFVLGLLVTGAAGLWGFVGVRRRNTLLQRELTAVNAAYESTRDRAHECERVLRERRVRAHMLLQEEKLDEAKVAFLEKRIDELQRKVRSATLDERLDYLPRGLARRLESLLEDGRVSAWERESFDALVDRDPVMTDEMKRNVKAMVADWRARDEEMEVARLSDEPGAPRSRGAGTAKAAERGTPAGRRRAS